MSRGAVAGLFIQSTHVIFVIIFCLNEHCYPMWITCVINVAIQRIYLDLRGGNEACVLLGGMTSLKYIITIILNLIVILTEVESKKRIQINIIGCYKRNEVIKSNTFDFRWVLQHFFIFLRCVWHYSLGYTIRFIK